MVIGVIKILGVFHRVHILRFFISRLVWTIFSTISLLLHVCVTIVTKCFQDKPLIASPYKMIGMVQGNPVPNSTFIQMCTKSS